MRSKLLRNSAGQQTTNLNKSAVWRRSDLRRQQPRIARTGAVLMWLIGLVGTLGAFYGGFPKMFAVSLNPLSVVPQFTTVDLLIRLGLAFGFQAVVTYFEFVYSGDWTRPGYFIPYLFDFGSNAFSYGPLLAPLVAAFLGALLGLFVKMTDPLRTLLIVVGWIATLFLIGVFTRLPELIFVEDDTATSQP